MKSFEDQIKALRGEFSSTSQISTDSNSYYLKKYGPDGTGGSMEFNGTFVPGKFYTCEYKTKTRVSDSHPFIDRYPLFIFLKKEKYKDTSIMISMDLNVIPPTIEAIYFLNFGISIIPCLKKIAILHTTHSYQ